MIKKKPTADVLPTKPASNQQVAAAKKKLVTTKALNHLVAKGAIQKMARANCCTPSGGTCCPNKK